MTTPQIQNDPIYNLGIAYINGLIVSNDVTTPATSLDISSGMCRDSNNIMDIVLGATNPNLEGAVTLAPLVINALANGVNGLDTGTLNANTMYAVYIIADSRYYNQTAGIVTLASNAAPLMPAGYDSMRLIAYIPTDGDGNFQVMSIFGNGNSRVLVYDAPLGITTVSSTTYAGVDISGVAPAVNNTPVHFYVDFAANAAADIFNAKPYNGTGDAFTLIAPVAGSAAHTTQTFTIIGSEVGGGIQIKAKVSAGTAPLYIAGFEFSL